MSSLHKPSKRAGWGHPRPALGLLIMLTAAVTSTQPALGHDFWIEPSTYRPEVASSVRLALRVGEDFTGRAVLRSQDRIGRFVVFGPRGERTVAGIEARDPAGFARIDIPGTYVVGYRSLRSSITLEGTRFEKYLAAEGLDAVLEERRRRGESRADGREVFSRCAKTVLLSSGGAAGAGYDTGAARTAPMGCPFELVLETHHAEPTAGGTISVRVLYLDRPLGGTKVVALTRGPNGRHLTVRSDADGRAEFSIDVAGPWLVKAVHMVEAPEEIDADWESFWASITFEAGAP